MDVNSSLDNDGVSEIFLDVYIPLYMNFRPQTSHYTAEMCAGICLTAQQTFSWRHVRYKENKHSTSKSQLETNGTTWIYPINNHQFMRDSAYIVRSIELSVM
jgi:arginine deiminase